MENFYGYYKCRKCGKTFRKVEMENFDDAFESMVDLVDGNNPPLPKLYAYHFCDKTSTDVMSLADFVGFQKETT